VKLHRLRLRHVKGVQDATVRFPDSGLVVLDGPNEVGKSTLLEALDRLLDPRLKSSSRAAVITSLQPVGADVGPFVEAELSVGAVRVVFAKQWLRQPSTVLTIVEPTHEVLTGDDAAGRMAQILDEGLDRPLLEALRCAQSGSMRGIELGDSDVLSRALDAASGADMHTEDAAGLLSAAQEEYERYYTATGRPTGQLRSAVEAVNAATDAVVETQRALAEADQLIARRIEVGARLATAEEQAPAALAERDAAVEAARHVEAQRAHHARALEQHRLAVADLRRAEDDHHARAGLVEQVAERTQTAHNADAALRRAQEELHAQAEREAAARRVCVEADERLTRAEDDAAAAAREAHRAREGAETAELRQRLHAAQTATEELQEGRQRLAAEPVSPAVLRSLEAVERDLAVAAAGAEAAATTLTLEALSDAQSLTLNGQTVSLDRAGASAEHQVAQGAEVVLGGVRLRIDPHPDAVRYAGDRDRLRADLASTLSAVGCEDLAAARRRAEQRERERQHVDRLEEQLADALGGMRLDELNRAVADRDEAGDDEPPADVESLVLSAAESTEQERQARAMAERAHRAWTDQAAATATAQHQHQLAQADHQRAQDELSRVEAELASARATAGDDALSDGLRAHREAVDTAHQEVSEIASALDSAGADALELRLSESEAAWARARSRLDSVRAEFFDVKGRLEVTAAEGRHEAHERAEQWLSDARRRYASVERRARAARQLYSTLQRYRDQAHETYAAPYAREINRLGVAVYGDSFAVSVDSRLRITHRELDGVRVRFDQLSGGAAEQLGILARLAVASMVDPEHGVPVVIDDALGFTDPDRLRRIGTVVDTAGRRPGSQIIVLTCTPERYAAVAGAHRVTLSA
jgi:chromosome segregation ATPase